VKSRWPRWIVACALASAAAHAAPVADRHTGNHYILDCPDGCPQKALEAAIGRPSGIAVDDAGNVYFTSQNVAFRLGRDAVLTRIAGTGAPGYGGDDGPATGARLNLPESVFDNGDWLWMPVAGGIAVDREGNVVIADGGNGRLRRIDRDGTITTLGDDAGRAIEARYDVPQGVAIDRSGNLYFNSLYGALGRRSPAGEVVDLVGDPCHGPDWDVLCNSYALAIDEAGTLYFPDARCRVMRWDAARGLAYAAGAAPSPCGRSDDGLPAIGAKLGTPFGVALDADGQLYFTDLTFHCVRKVDRAGVLSTVAGTCGHVYANPWWSSPDVPFGGDGGLATDAKLWSPKGVAVDRDGNVYIADTGHLRIRKVTPDGLITTVAGNGEALPVMQVDSAVKAP
jgi:sugar lactone lactonase YvrE